MHEMSVAQNILEIVREHISDGEENKVRAIKLKIGELSGIVPDALEFCFSTMIDRTEFEQASLHIVHIPIAAVCNVCKQQSKLEYGVFICPSCYSNDIELLTGKEMQVVSIEVED